MLTDDLQSIDPINKYSLFITVNLSQLTRIFIVAESDVDILIFVHTIKSITDLETTRNVCLTCYDKCGWFKCMFNMLRRV